MEYLSIALGVIGAGVAVYFLVRAYMGKSGNKS